MQESWVQSQAWFQWEHTHTTHTPFTGNPEEPPMVAVRRVRRTNAPTRRTSTCYSLNILFCSLLTPPKFHHKDPHVWLWKNSAKLRRPELVESCYVKSGVKAGSISWRPTRHAKCRVLLAKGAPAKLSSCSRDLKRNG